MLDTLPDQAKGHLPPTGFDAALTAAAPDHPTAGDHFAPHADVVLPDGATSAIDQHAAHLPGFITDWLL
ncbi:hypothetical protein DPM33_26820 [Mesorhizobium hawassense]|uniref:Uncharacterized protein n=1 Tax=Mesorhizobium hawassense TaxID=1209954 RepID=A0A330HHI6_9HYPH|nr:hypothetical protein [Mesorhizobium hawassense]RAZ86962.1 hypothetical protein DPM33_26820 [Mesorhizobium hawassense]